MVLVVLTALEAAKMESSLSAYLLPDKGHDGDDSTVIQLDSTVIQLDSTVI